jgi:hypothetical protein
MVVHVAACAWLIFGLSNAPRITNKPAHERFTVRILNVPSPEPQAQQVAHATPHSITAPASEAPRPTTPSPAAAAPAPAPAAGGSLPSMPSVATQLALLKPRTQILIQPDAPPDILIQRPVMVPNILRWSAPAIPTKTIVPSPPQKSIVATLRPRIEPPNHEVTPADVRMSSTPFATTMATLAPSTTTPVVVHGPDPAKRIPETASKQAQPPTPAQIMSLSNLQVKEGPVQIPLANSPASPAIHESTGTGPAVNSAGAGQGNPLSNQAGNGPGQSPSAAAGKSAAGSGTGTQAAKGSGAPGPAQAAKGNGAPGPAQAKNDGPSGSSPGPAADANPGPELGSVIGGPVTHIHLAKDGQYGFVVVGSQVAEQYPETVGLWGGRLVYTVYVHMGSGKPWILQYALPPAAQAAANNARPDAPWPFDIVQPHLDPADYTSDALMVHGFVNVAGRFDHLAVVFPSDFAKAKFLLSALQQWQFRPGRQNGQLAAIEILLIIPDQEE